MGERYTNRGTESNGGTELVSMDSSQLPWLRRGETYNMNVAGYPDHGRPVFFGSAIRSNPVFLDLARGLSTQDSERANERMRTEIEAILDGHQIRKGGVIPGGEKAPDIHQIIAGNPFDPSSLRIYYTQGEHRGTPAIFQLAIAKQKDQKRVERVLRDSGYTVNWN